MSGFSPSSGARELAGPGSRRQAFGTVFLGLVLIAPGLAQAITVFDPANYAQNLLQAARALQQINNQIKDLQNQASMIQSWARQLRPLDHTSIQQISGALLQIDGLMARAQGLSFDIAKAEDLLDRYFASSPSRAEGQVEAIAKARALWTQSVEGFRQAVRVQSQLVSGIAQDTEVLAMLAQDSQNAVGGLQAQQATNQLLALLSRQQIQTQVLLAAQGRAAVLEANRQAQALETARQTTRRFLRISPNPPEP